MPEYIEREKTISCLDELERTSRHNSVLWPDHVEECREALRSIPAANVRPNIPGKWIRENNPSYSPFDDSSEYLYRCSQCEEYNNRESAFCPDCGAQMRGGEQDGV